MSDDFRLMQKKSARLWASSRKIALRLLVLPQSWVKRRIQGNIETPSQGPHSCGKCAHDPNGGRVMLEWKEPTAEDVARWHYDRYDRDHKFSDIPPEAQKNHIDRWTQWIVEEDPDAMWERDLYTLAKAIQFEREIVIAHNIALAVYGSACVMGMGDATESIRLAKELREACARVDALTAKVLE